MKPYTQDGVEYKNGMKFWNWNGRLFKNYKEIEAVFDDAKILYSNEKVGWLLKRKEDEFGSIGVNCVFSSRQACLRFHARRLVAKADRLMARARNLQEAANKIEERTTA